MNNQQRADAILEATQGLVSGQVTQKAWAEEFRLLVLQHLCEAYADGTDAGRRSRTLPAQQGPTKEQDA